MMAQPTYGIEKLRELVETALDWFPDVKLLSLQGKTSGYYIIFDCPDGLVFMKWSAAFVGSHDDVALVAEVRHQLMQEAK